MIEIIEINELAQPGVEVFAGLTEAQLRASVEAESGIFIAESPKVINMALRHGYEPVSLLCEEKHIKGDASQIIDTFQKMPVLIPIYTGSRELLTQLTGYKLTRVLCAMKRKPCPPYRIPARARLVGVIESVTDTTNIGSIFRAASALGVDAIVLSDDACDPLNRRAVRVSMGTVFSLPWTVTGNPVKHLRETGFRTAALALSDDSISLDNPVLKTEPKLAVVFGTEGDGLCKKTIEACDYVVRIPMHHGVDSLNVASAAAVTFWELRRL